MDRGVERKEDREVGWQVDQKVARGGTREVGRYGGR